MKWVDAAQQHLQARLDIFIEDTLVSWKISERGTKLTLTFQNTTISLQQDRETNQCLQEEGGQVRYVPVEIYQAYVDYVFKHDPQLTKRS